MSSWRKTFQSAPAAIAAEDLRAAAIAQVEPVVSIRPRRYRGGGSIRRHEMTAFYHFQPPPAAIAAEDLVATVGASREFAFQSAPAAIAAEDAVGRQHGPRELHRFNPPPPLSRRRILVG